MPDQRRTQPFARPSRPADVQVSALTLTVDGRILGCVSEMTGSAVQERRGKRERLISAAAELVYRQEAQATTPAAIAEAADVPPGNVYYYFKTRDDLVRAVVDARTREIPSVLDALGQRPDPRSRLKALARTWSDQRDLVAESGCAIGSLCMELNKQGRDLEHQSSQLFAPLIDGPGTNFTRWDGPTHQTRRRRSSLRAGSGPARKQPPRPRTSRAPGSSAG